MLVEGQMKMINRKNNSNRIDSLALRYRIIVKSSDGNILNKSEDFSLKNILE
jgi:hypothetical protein